MKQILQNLKKGDIEITGVPAPEAKRRSLLIKTDKTLFKAELKNSL